ncbi:MAG: SH3 domain-containing protein [Pyrinomonadaceae bacterium]
MKRKLFLLLTMMAGLALNLPAQERYVRPVDEGPKDASFVSFREKLIKAVKEKDEKHLISVLDDDIKASFGGDEGVKDFQTFWKLDSGQSGVWEELLPVLTNGGKFVSGAPNKEFCAPYSFVAFPEDLDAFEYNIIFGNNVRLRSKPDLSSNVITKLSYNIVKIDWEKSVNDGKDDPTYIWYKVETLGKLNGFVSADYVRSPIDYRACFEKKKGVWKMTAFVAGD